METIGKEREYEISLLVLFKEHSCISYCEFFLNGTTFKLPVNMKVARKYTALELRGVTDHGPLVSPNYKIYFY